MDTPAEETVDPSSDAATADAVREIEEGVRDPEVADALREVGEHLRSFTFDPNGTLHEDG